MTEAGPLYFSGPSAFTLVSDSGCLLLRQIRAAHQAFICQAVKAAALRLLLEGFSLYSLQCKLSPLQTPVRKDQDAAFELKQRHTGNSCLRG